MLVASLALIGASAIHFGLAIQVGAVIVRDPFPGAAAPEAILGVIQGLGAIAMFINLSRSGGIAAATTSFTTLVVIYGLSITLRGGRVGDVTYHISILLLLVVTLVVLLARLRTLGRRVASDR